MADFNTIGAKRLEYLDLANKAYSNGSFDVTEKFLDSFLATIRENSVLADNIKIEFDKIEVKRTKTWDEIIKNTESLDSWTLTAVRHDNQLALVVEVLKDKINSCWQICITNGAFNE